MSVVVIGELQFTAESAAEGVAALRSLLPDTRAFDGCITVRLLVSQDDPSHAVLVEEWESRGQYEGYLKWRGAQRDTAIDPGTMAEAPRFTYFDPLH